MTATLANVQDIERCHLVGSISQLLVVRLDKVAEEFAAERVDITTLTRDVETIGTSLAGFTDIVDETLGQCLKCRLHGFRILLDQFEQLLLSCFRITGIPCAGSLIEQGQR